MRDLERATSSPISSRSRYLKYKQLVSYVMAIHLIRIKAALSCQIRMRTY